MMLVLPLLPAFDGNISASGSSNCTNVMHWQYRALRMLRKRITKAGADPDKYLSVYGLRTHDFLSDSTCVTEQVYVHSKAMIVDDRVAVVGSANINDRSLLGMRDSELNVVVRDNETTDGLLGGPWRPGAFAGRFRAALFAQHLGWSLEDLEGRFADPLSQETLSEVRRIARRNTQIYEDLFGVIPTDRIHSWSELAARRASHGAIAAGDSTREPQLDELHALDGIQGFLVEFPLHFLVAEDLAPPTFSVGALSPDCFT